MNLEMLLFELRGRGVELAADGDSLRFRAPKGVLTEAERATLVERKEEILATLRGDPVARVLSPSSPPRRPDRCSTAPIEEARADDHTRRAGPISTREEASPDSRPNDPSQNSQKSPKPVPIGVISEGDDRPDARPERLEDLAAGGLSGTASVTISGRDFPYFIWDGQALNSDTLGFDTETALIVADEVPALALASASSGSEHCLVHPDRVGEFLSLHRDRHIVFHNVAFDFRVVAKHLDARGESGALEHWWRMADEDRMHDTMLLDELIRLARTDAYPRHRDLGTVALEYAGLEIDKADPYRLRYGEIIGVDWAAVERGFFDYAVKDPIATLAAYRPMRAVAVKLMEAHGHDPSRRG